MRHLFPHLSIALILCGCADPSVGGEVAEGTDGDSDGMTPSEPGATSSGEGGDDSSSGDADDGSSSGSSSGDPSGDSSSGEPDDGSSSGQGDESSSGGSSDVLEANDDVVYAVQDELTNIPASAGVLANDTGPDGMTPTVVAAGPFSAVGADVVVEDDGEVIYHAPAGYWGPDSFEYIIEDADGNVASATVTVHVAPRNVALADVAGGLGGFAILGGQPSERAGARVSRAGDVNGDGLGDVLVGATDSDNGSGSVANTYVVFGKGDTDPVSLSTLGVDGITVLGDTDGSLLRVAGGGDFDGDGSDDFVVAVRSAANPRIVTGTDPVIPLGAFGDAGVEVLPWENVPQRLGSGLASLGDVNGDGLDDVAVGDDVADSLSGPSGSWAGRVAVVFGKADTSAVDLTALGDGGFVLGTSDPNVVFMGTSGSVGAAGDVNGDGLADLIVGSYVDSANTIPGAGRAFVVFGDEDTTTVDVAALGSRGFVINGASAQERSGVAVSGAGDFDGDGLDDIVVAASGAAGIRWRVVYGKADTSAVNLSALGTQGVVIEPDPAFAPSHPRVHTEAAGDVNGDGLGDIILSYTNSTETEGRVYVLYGTTSGNTIELADLGAGGFTFTPETNADGLGSAIAGAGDINDDGLDDLIVGAPDNGNGRAYVIYGTVTGEG